MYNLMFIKDKYHSQRKSYDLHHEVQIVFQIKKILALLFASSVHNTISQDEIENSIIEFFFNYTKLACLPTTSFPLFPLIDSF